MLVVAAVTAAALFLLSFVFGDIYAPMAGVIVMLLMTAALFLYGRGFFTRSNVLLALWLILISHRSFLPRSSVEEATGLFFVEVGVTLLVFFGAVISLVFSVDALRIRLFEARFWILAYTVLAGISLLWTPSPIYSAFWVIRLGCVAILLIVYFANANLEECKKFFLVTLLGSAPFIMLPIIGYFTGEGTSALGSRRVAGIWFGHPGVVSITAFSIAAASLTAMLQRGGGMGTRRFYLYVVLFVLGCTSGFLAAGKAGAFGGVIAVCLMLLISCRVRLWFGMAALIGLGYLLFELVLREMEIGLFAHAQKYDFDRFDTLQSRFQLWFAALDVWLSSIPTALLGRGFASFRTAHIASLTGWDPGHAHNSFVNLLVDMGVLGAFVFVAMLLRAVGGTIAVARRQGRAFGESLLFPPFITLISLLISSLMDDVFGGTLQPPTYLLIGTVITLDRLAYLSRLAVAEAQAPERLILTPGGGPHPQSGYPGR